MSTAAGALSPTRRRRSRSLRRSIAPAPSGSNTSTRHAQDPGCWRNDARCCVHRSADRRSTRIAASTRAALGDRLCSRLRVSWDNTTSSPLRWRLGAEALEGRQLLSANVIELPVANTAGTVNAIAVGLDGDIWYSESLLSGGNVLGRINPSTGAVIGQYPVASSSLTVPSLVAGPDNKIWFTEAHGNQIGRRVMGFFTYSL